MRAWLRARSSLLTTVVGAALVALLGAWAALAEGYPATQMELNDAAVWVTNRDDNMIGRANTEVRRLDTVVDHDSPQFDIVQDGRDVLLVDTANNTVSPIDPAQAQVGADVPLPPRAPEVASHAGRTVIASAATGELWMLTTADLADFSPSQSASMQLGEGGSWSLGRDGRLVALGEDGAVSVVGPLGASAEKTADDLGLGDDASIAAVGEGWAVLDRDHARLVTVDGSVDLASTPADDPQSVLEAGAKGGSVTVASPQGLVAVDLQSLTAETLAADELGEPIAPVTVAGCTYAAWQSGALRSVCPGAAPHADQVALEPGADLALRANGDRVVLNDRLHGSVWALQSDNEPIDNWSELVSEPPEDDTAIVPDADPDATTEREQQPPVAQDDDLGARPGTTSTLPVLANDYDLNGDLLTIDEVGDVPDSFGRLEIVGDQQQLQLTAAAEATGSAQFSYTISDGRGGTDTATVTVTMRGPDENSPPRQVHATHADVAAGDSTRISALDDWYDPDGDPLYLEAATTTSPDSVSHTTAGQLTFRDAGDDPGDKAIGLVVSDGRADAAGSVDVSVHDADATTLRADSFVVRATVGRDEVITPLDHVHGGAHSPRLSAAPDVEGATVDADFEAGTIRFRTEASGSHSLSYSVTDGTDTVSATIRVVAVDAPAESAPVTVPHVAVVEGQETVELNVLDGDYDPAGAVLLVTDVAEVPKDEPIQVEVLEHRTLRITLTGSIEGPALVRYRVSNGRAESEGTVTVVQTRARGTRQPPTALDDEVSVRVGDVVDIPVLRNDSHPDGDALSLDEQLVKDVGAGGGLLFASGDRLRYLAGDSPGNYSAAYRAVAPDGQWATAAVSLNVREADADSNSPPSAARITARVVAGNTVRIPIPLDDIDPDGDSVTLLGQQSTPDKGSVVAAGADWIDYEAGQYASGTDTFDYAVVDALGAQATGTIRVGIAEPSDVTHNPVAIPDDVVVRPGTRVSVRVLDNDIDPDGGALRLRSVTASGNDASARVHGDLVTIQAPRAEGTYGFVYEIENERGATSTNFVTVVVSRDAPLARPVASDTEVSLEDVIGRSVVDVDVLERVFLADGPISGLTVTAVPGYDDGVRIKDDDTVHVSIAERRQIIPVEVARSDDPTVSTYALVRVPGTEDTLPQLRANVADLTVASESTLTIDLNDYVVAAGDRTVRLTDRAAASATHSDGSALVVDDTTLSFTSAGQYFGPASLSFEVTDAAPGDDEGRVATLVLPITVTPRENQPPVFLGSTVELEPGQSRTLDLTALTRYPYAKNQSELAYSLEQASTDGVTLSVSGQTATIEVAETVPAQTRHRARIAVRDALNEGRAGRLTIDVVPSTRPKAVPRDDSVVVDRGTTSHLDVLANDQATNPFPDVPLRVVDVRGAEQAELPRGIRVEPSGDQSRLTIEVGEQAEVGDAVLAYQVADATDDPARFAWGSVRISVRDRPDPVSRLRIDDLGDRSMTVSWDAPAANNSPIEGYQITVTDAESGQALSTTSCESTSCSVSTPGNGPDHAVRVAVTAHNEVGESDPVRLSTPVWTDVPAPAPVDLRTTATDHGLIVSWAKPRASAASPITSYVVTLGEASRTVTVSAADRAGTRYRQRITDPALANGARVKARVEARNDVYDEAHWNSASVTGVPAGPPRRVGSISATPSRDGSGSVAVAARGAFEANGQKMTHYVIAASEADADAPRCDAESGEVTSAAASTTVKSLENPVTLEVTADETWSLRVFAFNAQGCTASDPAEATPLTPPSAPKHVSVAVADDEPREDGVYLPTFVGAGDAPEAPSGAETGYEYRFVADEIGQFETQPAGIRPGQRLKVPAEHRGESGGVQVRVVVALADDTRLVSPWSSTVPAGVAVDARADVTYEDGEFTWAGAPAAEGYSGVKFVCGYQTQSMPEAGSCSPGEYEPARLTVQVTVMQPNSQNVPAQWHQYVMTYDEE